MDGATIVSFVIAIVLIFDGVYAAIKGENFSQRGKPITNHEPVTYTKWVRFSGVTIALCGISCALLEFSRMGSIPFSDPAHFGLLIAVLVFLVLSVGSYFVMVKPADKEYFRNKKMKR